MIEAPITTNASWNQAWVKWLSRLWHWLRLALNSGSVTLANGTTTTTVIDSNSKTTSRIFLTSTTVGAAAEMGGTAMYISTKNDGSFVITHSNAATTRTFDYLIINP